MTYRPDFSGCWAKLQRAREHRNSLEAKIGPLFLGDANQVRIIGKLDPQTHYHVFRVAAIPEFPLLYFGVLIGDVVHNLRSVLDNLVWQLVLHKTGGQSPPDTEPAGLGSP